MLRDFLPSVQTVDDNRDGTTLDLLLSETRMEFCHVVCCTEMRCWNRHVGSEAIRHKPGNIIIRTRIWKDNYVWGVTGRHDRVKETAGDILSLLKSVRFMHQFDSRCCASAFPQGKSHGLKCFVCYFYDRSPTQLSMGDWNTLYYNASMLVFKSIFCK